MSDILRDISKIWSRLFDHKGFIGGEINFMLQKFEQNRGDQEVDDLFRIVENISGIKETKIDKLKLVIENIAHKNNKDLEEALDLCSRFVDLEENYKKDFLIDNRRRERKQKLDTYMKDITSSYTDINNDFEIKEEELTKIYTELEKKLN